MTVRKRNFCLFQLTPACYWAFLAYADSKGRYEFADSNILLFAMIVVPLVAMIAYLHHDGERKRNIIYVSCMSFILLLCGNSLINNSYAANKPIRDITSAGAIKTLADDTRFFAKNIELDSDGLLWYYTLQRGTLSITAMMPTKNDKEVWIVYRHETNYGHGPYYDNPERALENFSPYLYKADCSSLGWRSSLREALFDGLGRHHKMDNHVSGPGVHYMNEKSKVYVFCERIHYSDAPVATTGKGYRNIGTVIANLIYFFILPIALAFIIFIDYLQKDDDYDINLSWFRDLYDTDEDD